VKILHLLNSNQFSGAENVVCQIFHMMQNEPNIEMLYCSPEGSIRNSLEEKKIPFAAVTRLTVSEVKRVIGEFGPDLIHAHDMRASLIAALACGKLPLISHIHNNAYDSRGVSVKSIAYFFAAQKAKHIFWVSQSSFNGYCFHRLLEKKSSLLHNVINMDDIHCRMQEDKKDYDYDVVYVGRLTYPKNPQRLLNVIAKCVEEKPELKVAIVGNGELEEEARHLAEDLRILKNVSFLGFQKNPLKIMHDAKVLLMTSRWEGLPMCALEAMTLGTSEDHHLLNCMLSGKITRLGREGGIPKF